LDADAAVQLALVSNPRVQLLYAQLGLAQADLYDATRLSNPTLGVVRLTGADAPSKTDWSLAQNFTELLFWRFRRDGANSRLMQAKQQVAQALLALEVEVRSAWYRAVGSRMVATMRDRAAHTAQVSATYGQQLYDAGNISALQLSRLREAAGLAHVEQLRASAIATADRSALFTLMGQSTDGSTTDVAGQLPVPHAVELDVKKLSEWASQNRLDLRAAREALDFERVALNHSRRWRLLGDTTVGLGLERDGSVSGQPATTIRGPSASIGIPLFNQGGGAVLRERSAVELLQSTVRALELGIANDTRVAVARVLAAQAAIDEYRTRLVPEQKNIVDESQKQQNYMLIGTFELLSAKQHQYEGYQAYLDALRDYWIAYVELTRVTGGRVASAPESPLGYAPIDPDLSLDRASGATP
jgi:cobalt-zinc-cadmium efflux system outer membrane protein